MNLNLSRRTMLWIGIPLGVIILIVIGAALIGVFSLGGGYATSGAAGAPFPAAEPDYYDYAEEEMAAMEEPMAFDDAGGYGGGADGSAANQARSVDFDVVDTALASGEEAQQQQDRLIIRNGSISIQADDTVAAMESIDAMIEEMAGAGAFVVNRNQSGGGNDTDPYINMQIRVPVDRFDDVMERIAALATEGTTPSQSDYAEDVTAQYVDLSARLESLEAARVRLLELMENAPTTEELLLAEQQLTQREAELESLKGQLQYLSESARLSSISVDIQPYILSQPVDTRWRPAETFRRAIDRFLFGIRGLADGVITFLIAVLPFLLFWGLILYGIVRFVMWRLRVRRNKRAAGAAADDNS